MCLVPLFEQVAQVRIPRLDWPMYVFKDAVKMYGLMTKIQNFQDEIYQSSEPWWN